MNARTRRGQSQTAELIARFGERVLFIGAHPDDIEIGCGGTAAKLAHAGVHIGFAIASRERDPERAAIRAEEAKKAAAVLEISETDLFLGDLLDTQLEQRTDDLRTWLRDDVSDRFQPDTVFVHRSDDHTDHQAVFKTAIGVFQDKNIYLFYIPRPLPEVAFSPNHAEDISPYIVQKIKMCDAHASQPPDYVSEEVVRANARRWHTYWYSRIAPGPYRYAEAFIVYAWRSKVLPRAIGDQQTEEKQISARGKALSRVLEQWAHGPWLTKSRSARKGQIRRILHPLDDLPPLFYRWTLQSRHIHWIDFHYLMLVRQLLSVGVCGRVHLLVNDVEPLLSGSLPSQEDRDSLARIVAALLGRNATVHWLTAVVKRRPEYERLAIHQGLTNHVMAKLRRRYAKEKTVSDNLPCGGHQRVQDWGYETFKDWIQFTGWLVGDKNRCILIQWYRHAETVEWTLSNFYKMQSVVIRTPDLKLAGVLGKSGSPADEPLIDPPDFKSILDWLKGPATSQAVSDLVRYLSVEQPPVAEVDMLSSLKDEELETRFNLDGEFAREGKKLIGLLVHWNKMLFETWTHPAQQGTHGR